MPAPSAPCPGLVVARLGIGAHPDTDDSGAILGGRLVHLVRDTPWGAALRSHFFLGQDLPAAGLTPEVIAKEITDDFGPGSAPARLQRIHLPFEVPAVAVPR